MECFIIFKTRGAAERFGYDKTRFSDTILATESHKFSRKMRESIEIEKHTTIDQEGKPLDSTWRALFTMQN